MCEVQTLKAVEKALKAQKLLIELGAHEEVRAVNSLVARLQEKDIAEEPMPAGACPEKWAKAQAIKARMAVAFAQARERNAGQEEVASIKVVLHKSGQVSMSSERDGKFDSSASAFDQALLGQRVQGLAQELRDILLYGVRL